MCRNTHTRGKLVSGKEEKKEQEHGGKEKRTKPKLVPPAKFNGCRRVPLRDDPPRNSCHSYISFSYFKNKK
jgi:hypothetical protein